MFYTNLLYFYTTYTVLICITHYIIPSIPIDITFITLVTFIIGFYLSFIDPKKYIFWLSTKKYTVKGWKRLLSVDLIHLLVFLYGIYVFHPNGKNFMISFVLTIIYFLIISITNLYNIKNINTIILLYCLISIIYNIIIILYDK